MRSPADKPEPDGVELLPGLLQRVRPGSRLLLWQPPDWETPLELARRGYRLMPLSRDPELLGELKRQLRSCGLSSQLMGSAHLPADTSSNPPSLASRFYEAALLWGAGVADSLLLERLAPAMEVQAPLLVELPSSELTAGTEGAPRFRIVSPHSP